jgi:hypothetical protein
MGLDMYLSVRKYVSRIDGWNGSDPIPNDEFYKLVDVVNGRNLLDDDDFSGAYVELPVYYWRKFNAVHTFFIDNYADGVDECQQVYLPTSALVELVHRCDTILKDKSQASKLLPTAKGFFFGSTEYDEHYLERVKETRDDMKRLLKNLDGHEFSIIYQASW